MARITPYSRGQVQEIYKKFLNDEKCQNKAGGAWKNTKDSKMFEHTTKITNMMMLKTKQKKQIENAQARYQRGTMDHFANQFKRQKGQETSIIDP